MRISRIIRQWSGHIAPVIVCFPVWKHARTHTRTHTPSHPLSDTKHVHPARVSRPPGAEGKQGGIAEDRGRLSKTLRGLLHLVNPLDITAVLG